MSAAAPGYGPPTGIPGTEGLFNQVSTTTPDGTDVVIWLKPANPTALEAKVRRPGRTGWLNVTATIKDKPSMQELVISPAGASGVQATWVQYAGVEPEIFTASLDTRSRTWS